jgi:hypothetical protein
MEFIVELSSPDGAQKLNSSLLDAATEVHQLSETSFVISARSAELPRVAEALAAWLNHFPEATIVLRPKISPEPEYNVTIEYPITSRKLTRLLRSMSPDHKDSFEAAQEYRTAPPEWKPIQRYAARGEQIDPTNTLPVSIYLSDADIHQQVEEAVVALLDSAGLEIIERGEPEIGSWFWRARAKLSDKVPPELGRDAAATLAHAAEARFVTAQDAQITAMLMQNLPGVIGALQPTRDAAIRVGALLVVKVNWVVVVHQLTAAQQFQLDHHPELEAQPHEILRALALPQPDGTQASAAETSADSQPEGRA